MRLILFTILLLLSHLCLAQQPYFYKIDSENGFVSNEVYQIKQDSFGFMWIGCDAGIFRYDGTTFKQFVHPKQNGRSVSHIIIDEQQRVWCQNFAGQIFYIQHDSIHLYIDVSKEIRSYPTYTVSDGILTIFTNKGITQIEIETKKEFAQFINQFEGKGFFVDEIVSTNQSIYIHARDNIFYKTNETGFKPLFKNGEISCQKFFQWKDKVWALVQTEKDKRYHFIKFENDKYKIAKTIDNSIFQGNIYMINPIGNGLGIGTSNGLFLFNDSLNIQQHIFPNEKNADVFLDNENNLWLTSLQNGIYVIPSRNMEIYQTETFVDANLTYLLPQKDKLMIGTYSGSVYQFDVKTKKNRLIELPLKNAQRVPTIRTLTETDQYFVVSNSLKTILTDKKRQEKRVLDFTNARSIYIDKDSIVMGNSRCVAIQTLAQKSARYRVIADGACRAITKHPTKPVFYLATKHGFFEYKNGQTKPIRKINENVFPTCFAWYRDTLLIGTLADGLWSFYDGEFQQQYLFQHTIRTMKVHENQLFVATGNGLVKMNLTTKKTDLIDFTDGLHQKEIAAIEVINNKVYLATTKGLIAFPINENIKNTYQPNLHLTKVVLNDSINLKPDFQVFKYFQNNFRIYFQTALFRSRGDFFYEYRLKGLNENWQQKSSNEPFVDYRLLDAGNYVFEVRVVNEDELRSEIQTFEFKIKLPIWKRWWFILLVFLSVILIAIWFVNNRIRNIRRQAKVEKELKSSQLSALKARMNPHFLYNALNSIQVLILQKDVKKASRYLTKFSYLMRQILDASGEETIALSDEIKMLELYLTLEKLRFGDNFEYKIYLPQHSEFETIYIPSMIVQPFVENAVKHGLLHKTKGQKQLDITFEVNKLVICTITDNGIGRKKAAEIQQRQGKKTTSFATSATQKRLEILNQRFKNTIGLEVEDLEENEQAIGTKVILRIPIMN